MTGNPDTIEAAQRHIDMGFAVIPIATGKKKPVMDNWAKNPVLTKEMAATFLSNPGTQNYGLVMPPESEDKIIVFDLDNGDGASERWEDRIKAQQALYGELPRTKHTRTPSGGRHLFFRWYGELPKGDTFLGWTLRVLNKRHQVLGPGSVVDGKAYVDPYPYLPIADLPDRWVSAYKDTVKGPPTTIRGVVEPNGPLITVPEASLGYEMPASVDAGGRYAAIRDYVASRWNRGVTDEELWASVKDVLAPRFTVPLTETELRERFDRTLEGIDKRLGERAIDKTPPTGGVVVSSSKIAASSSLIVGIDDYRAATPSVIPWVVEPFAYLGGVTLVSGAPKAGKSSLNANLQRCRETDDLFLGSLPVPVGPTLLVTEEGGIPVVYKTSGLHALQVLDRKAAVAASLDWVGMLNLVADWAEVNTSGLVFIDTLAIWAGLKDENDASAVTRVIGQAAYVAQARNVAVVLVHHTRKGGGDNGEAIRGSSAMLATVDLSLELSRPDDVEQSDDRWLDVSGRVVMPARHRLTFDRPTLTYSLVDPDAAWAAEIEKLLTGVPVKGAPVGATRDDLRALWRRDPRNSIERLLRAGRLHEERVKVGRVHSLHYWAVPAVSRLRVRSSTLARPDDEEPGE